MKRENLDQFLAGVNELIGPPNAPVAGMDSSSQAALDIAVANIGRVCRGEPVAELLYLKNRELATPKREMVALGKLAVVEAHLDRVGFRGKTEPERGIRISRTDENNETTSVYETVFQNLGKGHIELASLVAMKKTITRLSAIISPITLGTEVQILLFNAGATEGELIQKGLPPKTINFFQEYLNGKAA